MHIRRGIFYTALISLISFNVNAAGFALIENGSSGLGNAYAGASAVAEDASTIYFNPAGLSKLDGQQFLVAGHYISTKSAFSNSNSTVSGTFGGGALPGPNSDGGGDSFVPSFFYSNKINETWSFGLGITVPFGLGTEYDENWVGRYRAIKSEIHTTNINPSVAYKVNDKFSVGFGVSAQYIEATLTNRIDSAAYCLGALGDPGGLCSGGNLNAGNVGNATYDSAQNLSGDDWSIGWNIGLLYNLSSSTQLGVSYRSDIDQKLTGTVDFTVNSDLQAVLTTIGSSLLSDTGIAAGIHLPESFSISLSHDIDQKWKILADATWMKWERYGQIVIDFDNPAQANSTLSPNYQNQWRYSVGATFKPDSKKSKKARGFLLGQVMQKSKGQANPKVVSEILAKKLG